MVLCGAIKMQIVKNQRFHLGVGVVRVDTGADAWEIVFVDDLVAFKIKSPVADAGVLGDHFLLGIDKTTVTHALVPHGMDDADFGLVEALYERQRVVRALAHSDNEFVDEGQQRTDRLGKGKSQRVAIADKGKAADAGLRRRGWCHSGLSRVRKARWCRPASRCCPDGRVWRKPRWRLKAGCGCPIPAVCRGP